MEYQTDFFEKSQPEENKAPAKTEVSTTYSGVNESGREEEDVSGPVDGCAQCETGRCYKHGHNVFKSMGVIKVKREKGQDKQNK